MRLIATVACLAWATGCGSASAGTDFSVVTGVPAEWVGRIDEARYLDAAECASLCPATHRAHVTSCHLARVTGALASPDTAAVVCNGSETKEP